MTDDLEKEREQNSKLVEQHQQEVSELQEKHANELEELRKQLNEYKQISDNDGEAKSKLNQDLIDLRNEHESYKKEVIFMNNDNDKKNKHVIIYYHYFLIFSTNMHTYTFHYIYIG